MNRKILVKIKSIPELEEKFGKNWRRILGWNWFGRMDHFAGKTLVCIYDESIKRIKFFDKKAKQEWFFGKDSYIEIKIKERIDKLLKI